METIKQNKEKNGGQRRAKLSDFIKDLEGALVKPESLVDLVSGQRGLKERNLSILKRIVDGADISDPEFQAEVGVGYQMLCRIEKTNLDVIYQLISGESPEKRKAWRNLEYRKMYRKAQKCAFKHDELDVVSEMRKEDQGDSDISKTVNVGIQIYIPAVADEGKFNDMVGNMFNKKNVEIANVSSV